MSRLPAAISPALRRFHDELDAAFLGESRGVGHDLVVLSVALGLRFAKRQRVLQAERVRVFDLFARVGNRAGEGEIIFDAERAHVRLQSARGDLLLQR